MPMRQQDLFQRDALAVGSEKDSVDIASGVDDRSPHRLGTPENGAILFKRCDGDYDVTHIANASTATSIDDPRTTGQRRPVPSSPITFAGQMRKTERPDPSDARPSPGR